MRYASGKQVNTKRHGTGLIDETTWEQGLRDLESAAQLDGIFSYTFFRAVGQRTQ